MRVYLGTAPLAHSHYLEVGFGKSLDLLFHSTSVYMGTVAPPRGFMSPSFDTVLDESTQKEGLPSHACCHS